MEVEKTVQKVDEHPDNYYEPGNVNRIADSEKQTTLWQEVEIKDFIKEEDETGEKYKKIAYEYYIKSEDLEQKCSILHKNLADVKEAWDKTELKRHEALKERETMTLKYASGERKLLAEKQLREKTEKELRKISEEYKLIKQQLHATIEEKDKIHAMYNKKLIEHKQIKTETEGIKNDNFILRNELKLCQNALKNQADLYKSNLKELKELNDKVSKSHEEKDVIIKEADEKIQSFKTSEENQAFILNHKVEEQQTSIILIKHENEKKENELKSLHSHLEILKMKNKDLSEKNQHLFLKIQKLEKENTQHGKQVNELKNEEKRKEQFLREMHEKSNKMDQLELEIIEEKRKTEILSELKENLEEEHKNLLDEFESLKNKEIESLNFTQKLIDNNMKLQFECSNLEGKLNELISEKKSILKKNEASETKIIILRKKLNEINENYLLENNTAIEEVEKMKKSLSKQKTVNFHLKQQLLEHKNDIQILKRKLVLSVREMKRELNNRSTLTSCTSLATNHKYQKTQDFLQNDCVQVIQPICEMNSNILIERLVKLQRTIARKSEKIDFLEDQVNNLLFELRKKNNLLQTFMLKEQTGVLTPNEMDENKTIFVKLGGVMGSIFGNKIIDSHLTLELSLEINKRLQAVLEDSLLKNIILKKSIDTLGQEIDRLKSK